MTDHALVFPEDFGDYEAEITAKGWFAEARLSVSGKQYQLSFFDAARLAQEVEGELGRHGVFLERNLIVVRSVDKHHMEKAVELLVCSGAMLSLLQES